MLGIATHDELHIYEGLIRVLRDRFRPCMRIFYQHLKGFTPIRNHTQKRSIEPLLIVFSHIAQLNLSDVWTHSSYPRIEVLASFISYSQVHI